MIWDEFQPISEYAVSWETKDVGSRPGLAEALSSVFDAAFGWVNDSIEGRFLSIDEQRAKMLAQDPNLAIKGLEDGYQLESERLLAIQQRNSRGFTIYDINPGLLNRNDFALSLPYEFLFDGTNYIPADNGSLAANFRSVNLQIPGNFLKVEFIHEDNNLSNESFDGKYVPYAAIKYQDALSLGDDLSLYKQWHFDNFARTKVMVNFSSINEKPHIVSKSGDYFNTYFSEVTITMLAGAPKVRITVGFNSEKHDGPSMAPINAQLHMLGTGRLFAENESIMFPYCVTEQDHYTAGTTVKTLSVTTSEVTSSWPLIENNLGVTADGQFPIGYSVFWISRINFFMNGADGAASKVNYRVLLDIRDNLGTDKRVTGFLMETNSNTDRYVAEFDTPICVVLPLYSYLRLSLAVQGSVATTIKYGYSIEGYSYGEFNSIFQIAPSAKTSILTSKFLTDSTLLAQFNRGNVLRG